MKTTQWDRVITSSPLNKTAAVVRDGKSQEFKFVEIDGAHLRDAPYILKNASDKTFKNNASFQDLTGATIGRITVLGIIDKSKHGLSSKSPVAQGKWAVRCTCGRYQAVNSKTMKRALRGEGMDRCNECHAHNQVRLGLRGKSDAIDAIRSELST